MSRVVGFLLTALVLATMEGRGCGQDTNELFKQWFAAQTNLQTWSADLLQTRSLTVLAQPLVSTGKVWFQYPNCFRWELGQPAQTIALRQSNHLFIIYPRLKRAEKYPLVNVPPGPAKDAFALVEASFSRDLPGPSSPFQLRSALVTNSALQVRLEPKSASARKFVAEVLVGFRTNDFSLVATELRFADGSSLRNEFTNMVLNRPLDPQLFEPKLPQDFTLVEPLRR